jgi:manganese transport protein
VFDIIRRDYPPKLGFFTLVAAKIVNVLTCAAEIGGVALILQLLSGYSYRLLIVATVLSLIVIIWLVPFKGIERLFGYLGVGLVVFVIVAIKTTPGLSHLAHGLIPQGLQGSELLTYWYFAVGLIAATLMPYEVYFYSSGGIEEGWKPEDIGENRMNATLGFGVGALVAAGIIVAAANQFFPVSINPSYIGTPALATVMSLGKIALLVTLLGMLFAIAGSAVETAFSGAYNLSQYAGWRWGRHLPPLKTLRFTWSWIIILLVAGAIIMTGLDPIALTEYSVLLSAVIMPLTYFPVLQMARNKAAMGKYVNGRLANSLGWLYLVIIVLVSVAAVPLLVITGRGQL